MSESENDRYRHNGLVQFDKVNDLKNIINNFEEEKSDNTDSEDFVDASNSLSPAFESFSVGKTPEGTRTYDSSRLGTLTNDIVQCMEEENGKQYPQTDKRDQGTKPSATVIHSDQAQSGLDSKIAVKEENEATSTSVEMVYESDKGQLSISSEPDSPYVTCTSSSTQTHPSDAVEDSVMKEDSCEENEGRSETVCVCEKDQLHVFTSSEPELLSSSHIIELTKASTPSSTRLKSKSNGIVVAMLVMLVSTAMLLLMVASGCLKYASLSIELHQQKLRLHELSNTLIERDQSHIALSKQTVKLSSFKTGMQETEKTYKPKACLIRTLLTTNTSNSTSFNQSVHYLPQDSTTSQMVYQHLSKPVLQNFSYGFSNHSEMYMHTSTQGTMCPKYNQPYPPVLAQPIVEAKLQNESTVYPVYQGSSELTVHKAFTPVDLMQCTHAEFPVNHSVMYKLDKLHQKQQDFDHIHVHMHVQLSVTPRSFILAQVFQSLVEAKLWSVSNDVYVPYPTIYHVIPYYQGSSELTVHKTFIPEPLVECRRTSCLQIGDTDIPFNSSFMHKLDRLHQKQQDSYKHTRFALLLLKPHVSAVLDQFLQSLVEAKLWSVSDDVYVSYPTIYPVIPYYQGSSELTVHKASTPKPLVQCTYTYREIPVNHSVLYKLDKLHQKQQDFDHVHTYVQLSVTPRLFVLSQFLRSLVEAKVWSVSAGVYVSYPAIYPVIPYYQGSSELTVYHVHSFESMIQCTSGVRTCHHGDMDTHCDHSFMYQLEKLHQKRIIEQKFEPLPYMEEFELHYLSQVLLLSELKQTHTPSQSNCSKSDYPLVVFVKPREMPSSMLESLISILANACLWVMKVQVGQLPIVSIFLLVELVITLIVVFVGELLRSFLSSQTVETEHHSYLRCKEQKTSSFKYTYKVVLVLLCLASLFTVSDPHTLLEKESHSNTNPHVMLSHSKSPVFPNNTTSSAYAAQLDDKVCNAHTRNQTDHTTVLRNSSNSNDMVNQGMWYANSTTPGGIVAVGQENKPYQTVLVIVVSLVFLLAIVPSISAIAMILRNWRYILFEIQHHMHLSDILSALYLARIRLYSFLDYCTALLQKILPVSDPVDSQSLDQTTTKGSGSDSNGVLSTPSGQTTDFYQTESRSPSTLPHENDRSQADEGGDEPSTHPKEPISAHHENLNGHSVEPDPKLGLCLSVTPQLISSQCDSLQHSEQTLDISSFFTIRNENQLLATVQVIVHHTAGGSVQNTIPSEFEVLAASLAKFFLNATRGHSDTTRAIVNNFGHGKMDMFKESMAVARNSSRVRVASDLNILYFSRVSNINDQVFTTDFACLFLLMCGGGEMSMTSFQFFFDGSANSRLALPAPNCNDNPITGLTTQSIAPTVWTGSFSRSNLAANSIDVLKLPQACSDRFSVMHELTKLTHGSLDSPTSTRFTIPPQFDNKHRPPTAAHNNKMHHSAITSAPLSLDLKSQRKPTKVSVSASPMTPPVLKHAEGFSPQPKSEHAFERQTSKDSGIYSLCSSVSTSSVAPDLSPQFEIDLATKSKEVRSLLLPEQAQGGQNLDGKNLTSTSGINAREAIVLNKSLRKFPLDTGQKQKLIIAAAISDSTISISDDCPSLHTGTSLSKEKPPPTLNFDLKIQPDDSNLAAKSATHDVVHNETLQLDTGQKNLALASGACHGSHSVSKGEPPPTLNFQFQVLQKQTRQQPYDSNLAAKSTIHGREDFVLKDKILLDTGQKKSIPVSSDSADKGPSLSKGKPPPTLKFDPQVFQKQTGQWSDGSNLAAKSTTVHNETLLLDTGQKNLAVVSDSANTCNVEPSLSKGEPPPTLNFDPKIQPADSNLAAKSATHDVVHNETLQLDTGQKNLALASGACHGSHSVSKGEPPPTLNIHFQVLQKQTRQQPYDSNLAAKSTIHGREDFVLKDKILLDTGQKKSIPVSSDSANACDKGPSLSNGQPPPTLKCDSQVLQKQTGQWSGGSNLVAKSTTVHNETLLLDTGQKNLAVVSDSANTCNVEPSLSKGEPPPTLKCDIHGKKDLVLSKKILLDTGQKSTPVSDSVNACDKGPSLSKGEPPPTLKCDSQVLQKQIGQWSGGSNLTAKSTTHDVVHNETLPLDTGQKNPISNSATISNLKQSLSKGEPPPTLKSDHHLSPPLCTHQRTNVASLASPTLLLSMPLSKGEPPPFKHCPLIQPRDTGNVCPTPTKPESTPTAFLLPSKEEPPPPQILARENGNHQQATEPNLNVLLPPSTKEPPPLKHSPSPIVDSPVTPPGNLHAILPSSHGQSQPLNFRCCEEETQWQQRGEIVLVPSCISHLYSSQCQHMRDTEREDSSPPQTDEEDMVSPLPGHGCLPRPVAESPPQTQLLQGGSNPLASATFSPDTTIGIQSDTDDFKWFTAVSEVDHSTVKIQFQPAIPLPQPVQYPICVDGNGTMATLVEQSSVQSVQTIGGCMMPIQCTGRPHVSEMVTGRTL